MDASQEDTTNTTKSAPPPKFVAATKPAYRNPFVSAGFVTDFVGNLGTQTTMTGVTTIAPTSTPTPTPASKSDPKPDPIKQTTTAAVSTTTSPSPPSKPEPIPDRKPEPSKQATMAGVVTTTAAPPPEPERKPVPMLESKPDLKHAPTSDPEPTVCCITCRWQSSASFFFCRLQHGHLAHLKLLQ